MTTCFFRNFNILKSADLANFSHFQEHTCFPLSTLWFYPYMMIGWMGWGVEGIEGVHVFIENTKVLYRQIFWYSCSLYFRYAIIAMHWCFPPQFIYARNCEPSLQPAAIYLNVSSLFEIKNLCTGNKFGWRLGFSGLISQRPRPSTPSWLAEL